MKLKGKLTILINSDYTRIEIEDANASTTFLKIDLTPEQLSECLSRTAMVDVELQVQGTERIGKKHEHQSFEFKIPEHLVGYGKKDEVIKHAKTLIPKGWQADNYMGSQNSFFTKDRESWGRIIIRRWI